MLGRSDEKLKVAAEEVKKRSSTSDESIHVSMRTYKNYKLLYIASSVL